MLLCQDPNVNYLMTLYLCREIDADDIAKRAKESHVVGVGSPLAGCNYPPGDVQCCRIAFLLNANTLEAGPFK